MLHPARHISAASACLATSSNMSMASCRAPLLHSPGVFPWLSQSRRRWQASSLSCMLGRLATSAIRCLYSCSAAVGGAGAAEDAVGSSAAADAEAAAVREAIADPRTAAAASAVAAGCGAGGAAEHSGDPAGTGAAAAAKSMFDAASAVLTSSTGSTTLSLGAWSGAGCGPSDCCLLRCKWRHPTGQFGQFRIKATTSSDDCKTTPILQLETKAHLVAVQDVPGQSHAGHYSK